MHICIAHTYPNTKVLVKAVNSLQAAMFIATSYEHVHLVMYIVETIHHARQTILLITIKTPNNK